MSPPPIPSMPDALFTAVTSVTGQVIPAPTRTSSSQIVSLLVLFAEEPYRFFERIYVALVRDDVRLEQSARALVVPVEAAEADLPAADGVDVEVGELFVLAGLFYRVLATVRGDGCGHRHGPRG